MAFGATTQPPAPHGFGHEALFYEGTAAFLAHVTPFVRDGLDAGEAVLVVVDVDKIRALRDDLGSAAAAVQFADMAVVGANPARIIPVWRAFLSEHAGGDRASGASANRSGRSAGATSSSESTRHESLLNVAFADATPWWLLCPYDTS